MDGSRTISAFDMEMDIHIFTEGNLKNPVRMIKEGAIESLWGQEKVEKIEKGSKEKQKLLKPFDFSQRTQNFF